MTNIADAETGKRAVGQEIVAACEIESGLGIEPFMREAEGQKQDGAEDAQQDCRSRHPLRHRRSRSGSL